MGIDGIGSKGPPAPAPPGPPGGSSPVDRFDVTPNALDPAAARPGAGAPGTSTVSAAGAAASPLERWRAGEVDQAGYVELKVDEATRHLIGLPPAELDAIRAVLRDRLATDPALVDLVRTVTGEVPRLPDER